MYTTSQTSLTRFKKKKVLPVNNVFFGLIFLTSSRACAVKEYIKKELEENNEKPRAISRTDPWQSKVC
jgi:hypothetical protein